METEEAFLGLRPMSSPPEVDYPVGEPSISLQLFIKFFFEIQHKKICISDDGTETCLGHTTDRPVIDFLWLDISSFSNNRQALHDKLSSTLAGLGIHSSHHESLISMVIQNVARVTNSGSKELKVLPLLFDIVVLRTEYFRWIPVVDRVMRESRLENESQNYGMVPTAPESRILERVKVAGCDSAEICTICLEEIVDFAASMPCAHLFHGNCILEWLKMSHYCPLCRFEMPTETVSS